MSFYEFEKNKKGLDGFRFFGFARERKTERVKRQSLNRVKERVVFP